MSIDRKRFGQKIAELRMQAGLSQSECARALGVTNKAVSKWETGATFPTIDTLVKVADLYNVTLGDLFGSIEEASDDVYVLAVVGGPCAGMSIAVQVIREQAERRGWKVFVASEVATDLIESGCGLNDCGGAYGFQRHVFELQLARENALVEAAREWSALHQSAHSTFPTRALVLCDRGMPDNGAFLTDEEFARLLSAHAMTKEQLLARYQGIVRLESAAHNAGAYTLENNPARHESQADALASDSRVEAAWRDHPRLAVVRATDTFDVKLLDACTQAFNLIGIPAPHALAERRTVLVKKPPRETFAQRTGAVVDFETVTFLEPRQGSRLALVMRRRFGQTSFFRTVSHGAGACELEPEEPIEGGAYHALKAYADPALKPVSRTNVRFTVDGTLLEIHFYDFYPYVATCDIDVSLDGPLPKLPAYLELVRETTGSDTFTLRHMARQLAQGRL